MMPFRQITSCNQLHNTISANLNGILSPTISSIPLPAVPIPGALNPIPLRVFTNQTLINNHPGYYAIHFLSASIFSFASSGCPRAYRITKFEC